jgi:uncharacterized protein (TIRG00374 family)
MRPAEDGRRAADREPTADRGCAADGEPTASHGGGEEGAHAAAEQSETHARQPETGITLSSLGKVALGLGLGAALLALIARGIDLGQFWQALVRADPGWTAAAFLAVLLTTTAKVVRWQQLIPPPRPGLPALGKALLIGQMVNALLPVRAGDIARAYVIGQETETGAATALGTIAAEKAYDLAFLLLSGAAAALLVPLPSWLNVSLIGLTAGGILLAILLVAWPERRLLSWVERKADRLPWNAGPRLLAPLQRALSGMAALRKPRMALVALAWSAAIWMLATATNYALFRAFALGLDFGAADRVGAALLLLVLLHAGIAPPSSPGRLGVFDAIALLGLEALGIDRSRGLAYALTLHLIVYLPEIVPGALLLALGRRKPQT